MNRLVIIFAGSILLFSCTTSTGRLLGSMSEPQEIEVGAPFIDVDSVPLLYGFVSDSFEDAIFPLNLSLRKFVESEVPYFPLRIPVGRYPTKVSIDNSQKRLFVLNYLDKNISVIDTTALIEKGFGMFKDGKIVYTIDNKPIRKDIGLFVSDMKVVYNLILNKEYLIVVGVDDLLKGRIKVIDVDEKSNDNSVNKNIGDVYIDVEVDIVPSVLATSPNGDDIFIGSKSGNRFAILNISARGIFYVAASISPNVVRYNDSKLYLIDTVESKFSVFDIDRKVFHPVLPTSIFGDITVQPFQTKRVRDIAFSPNTDLGGVIESLSVNHGCKKTVAFLINTEGSIFAIDVDGCLLCEEADSNLARVPCYLKGWFNQPVEDEITRPTVSKPILQVEGRVLSASEQGLAEYPYIDKWNDSERNFGIGISKLFRSNMYDREIQVTYEGSIVEGIGSIMDGKFVPDVKGFENFNITNLDLIDIRDLSGNPLRNCDDGSLIDNNEFKILSVSREGIIVEGDLPKDDCLEKYYFIIRPINGWTVHVAGYGFLGRAYENQVFELRDDKGFSHLRFLIKSGKNTSRRGMKFRSTVFIYPYGFSPGEKLFTPASIKVVQDVVDRERFYGLVVYTGSKAVWQFSSRDLDPNSSVVYK
ncbi:MAG: hypothetical protein N2746_06235 [Deltaproteobacteria bacterium]|nr:hypothetical protein [Deltaproteobacteria bacterium]